MRGHSREKLKTPQAGRGVTEDYAKEEAGWTEGEVLTKW